MSAESALTNPDVLLRNAFDSARPGMALVERSGRFIRVNPALCQMVGYPEGEFRKLTFQEITHPDDLAPDLENAERLLRGEISGYEMEKRYFRKDGSIVWILLDVSPVRDSKGRPLCFGVQIHDLTKRKEEEENLTGELMRRLFLEEANADLLQSEDGSRLLKMLRALSHERSLFRQKVSEVALEILLSSPAGGERAGSGALLTEREKTILTFVELGKTSREIAHSLGISPRTVEAHRAAVTRKIKSSPHNLFQAV